MYVQRVFGRGSGLTVIISLKESFHLIYVLQNSTILPLIVYVNVTSGYVKISVSGLRTDETTNVYNSSSILNDNVNLSSLNSLYVQSYTTDRDSDLRSLKKISASLTHTFTQCPFCLFLNTRYNIAQRIWFLCQ